MRQCGSVASARAMALGTSRSLAPNHNWPTFAEPNRLTYSPPLAPYVTGAGSTMAFGQPNEGLREISLFC